MHVTFVDKLLVNVTTLTKDGLQQASQAIGIVGASIAWCGAMRDLPRDYQTSVPNVMDAEGKLLTPGLIDCHTHLVYAGNRADEFKLRLDGVSYADIARHGGGILSTVRQTRSVSEEVLLQQSLPRILALRAEGVTTVEIKSGYGLDLATELKMLRVAKRLGELSGVRVRTTFLGAHAIPPEFASQKQAYVDYLCHEVMPLVVEAGLADAMDVFCESIAFSRAETEQLFATAHALGLPIKCHAEQLSNMGATLLATKYQALSCDHLEFLDAEGATAMAGAGTVAVLLPGAYYFLRETRKPPIDLLREACVGIAIASDCNPGSAPTTSLLLMMNMACQLFSLTVPETLSAVTFQAARALGMEQQVGTLAVGMAADMVLWSTRDSAELCYYFGHCLAHQTMIAGVWI